MLKALFKTLILRKPAFIWPQFHRVSLAERFPQHRMFQTGQYILETTNNRRCFRIVPTSALPQLTFSGQTGRPGPPVFHLELLMANTASSFKRVLIPRKVGLSLMPRLRKSALFLPMLNRWSLRHGSFALGQFRFLLPEMTYRWFCCH